MTKQTPGPWHVGGDTECGLWVSGPDTAKNVICDIVGREQNDIAPGGYCPEDEANARLIAAAPDLLFACKAMAADFMSLVSEDVWYASSRPSELLRKLEAAVKRAEG